MLIDGISELGWKVGAIVALFALFFVVRVASGGKPDLLPVRRRRRRTRIGAISERAPVDSPERER